MLTDEQLRTIHSDAFNAGSRDVRTASMEALRAVEVAVRADQIEKDAKLADSIKSNHFPGTMGWASAERVSDTIRAQLPPKETKNA